MLFWKTDRKIFITISPISFSIKICMLRKNIVFVYRIAWDNKLFFHWTFTHTYVTICLINPETYGYISNSVNIQRSLFLLQLGKSLCAFVWRFLPGKRYISNSFDLVTKSQKLNRISKKTLKITQKCRQSMNFAMKPFSRN